MNNPSPRIVYTVTVNNVGPSDSQGVVMVDSLPLDPKKIVYVFDTGNGACGYSVATHQVTCNAGSLAAGAYVVGRHRCRRARLRGPHHQQRNGEFDDDRS